MTIEANPLGQSFLEPQKRVVPHSILPPKESLQPDLILVNCVHREITGSISQSPQLGLLYIASTVRQAGYQVALVAGDAVLREITKQCCNGSPFLVGFYVNSDNYQEATRVARLLKARFDWLRTIAGGPVASVQDFSLVNEGAFDFACRGDGEELVVELLNHLAFGSPSLPNILGLTYRADTGATQQNMPRPLLRNLDTFPIPDRSLYPLQTPELRSQLITSRGCGFRCTFCFESTNRRFRTHSAQRVIEEIRHLKELYGSTYVTFVDDVFTQDPSRVREICRLLLRTFRPHEDLFWYCESRVDQLIRNPDLLPLMQEAGLVRLQIGTESGSQEVIDAYKKHINLQQIVDAVGQCVEADVLSIHTNFILGGALETPETLAKTLELAQTLVALAPGRFEATTTYLSPYPGTDIASQPQKYQLRLLDPHFRTGLSDDYIFVETEALSKEDILRLGLAFRAELTKQMIGQLIQIPSELLLKHVDMTSHDLLTQWAELILNDPILGGWARLRGTGLYHDQYGEQPRENVFPLRTFDLAKVVANGGRLFWPSMGRKYEFRPAELRILELCSGKNSLQEVFDSESVDPITGSAFLQSLVHHKLVVFRWES